MTEPLPARFATGNKIVSLPDLRTADCALETLSFLHSGLRAAVEIHGNQQVPFLEPFLAVNGQDMPFQGAEWDQLSHWIPRFHLQTEKVDVTGIVFVPLEHKGFVWVIEIESRCRESLDISAGWRGCWQDTYDVVNLSKPMTGTRHGGFNRRHDSTCFVEFRYAAPMFAVGFCPDQPMKMEVFSDADPAAKVTATGGQSGVSATPDQAVLYSMATGLRLMPGESKRVVLQVGVGLEETSAVTTAVDLRRHGWQAMLNRLLKWLSARTYQVGDERLAEILNLNSFYNNFFSQGITLDAEQLVVVSSRSSRYHGSAVYKDRDAMLRSFPAVLLIDPMQARRMLEYAFTVQLRNVGVHSRFIDGVVLEPGFALDELCAPVRALWLYLRQTGDMSIVFDRRVQTGLNRIQQLLSSAKHPKLALYETMLEPSDDIARYPYVTYNNVLAWRALRDIAWIYDRIRDVDRTEETLDMVNAVKKAVTSNCVVQGPFGDMFAWSVDLEGNFELGDEPAGSLQLLAPLEFCSPDLPAYKNTVRWINSDQNPCSFAGSPFAAPGSRGGDHPCVLSIANQLLTGQTDSALDLLRRVRMDDLIACEYVDERTGEAAGGLAFAAASGYLAYALATALGLRTDAAIPPVRRHPTVDRLSEPPPEIRDSIDLGRL